jgi:transcriptional regulator with XRE-family HTH domain
MRQALAEVNPGMVLAVFRAAAGLSQLDLANLLGWSQSTVSLIESGRRQNLYDIRELLRFADAVDMPREALLPLILGRADATLVGDSTDVALQEIGKPLDRRTFSGMAAGLAASAILPQVQPPARVDAAHVRYLRACLQQIRNRYQQAGGGAVLGQALRHFARAKAILDDSDYTEAVGRQLLIVTAALGEAAGWAAYDQNNQQLARRLYNEAALMASSSGDPVVTVHVYTNLSQQSAYMALSTGRRGMAREALRFADQAAEIARHEPSPRLHALIALRQSRAHAALGDEDAFRSAISTARRELDRGPHTADPAWAMYISDSEITGYEALGHEALSRLHGHAFDKAVDLYRTVLADPTRTARDQAYYRARMAGALLDQGDLQQAIAEGTALLPLMSGGQMTSTRSLVELQPLRAAAERAAAEEFCARYDAAAQALTA